MQPIAGLRRRSISASTSVSEKREKEGGGGVRGILDRMQPQARARATGIGLEVTGAITRKNYALAPCHHLFVCFILSRPHTSIGI